MKRLSLFLIMALLMTTLAMAQSTEKKNDGYSLPESYQNSQNPSSTTATTPVPVEESKKKPKKTKKEKIKKEKPAKKEKQPKKEKAKEKQPKAAKEESLPPPPPPPPPEPAPVVEKPAEELPVAGYDGGFFIQDKEGKYKINWTGSVGFRYSVGLIETSNSDNIRHSFFVDDVTLIWAGHVFTPKFTWSIVLQPQAPVNAAGASINYAFYKALKLSVGRTSPKHNLGNLGEPLISASLDASRFRMGSSVGVWASGSFGKFAYNAGIFNGSGTGYGVNTNTELAYFGRLDLNALGSFGGDKVDLGRSDKPAIKLSLGGGFFHEDTSTQARVMLGGGMAGFKYKGFSFVGSGNVRLTDPDQFTSQQYDVGLTAVTSYALIKDKLYMALQYSALLDDLTNAGVNLRMSAGSLAELEDNFSGIDIDGDSSNEFEYTAGLVWNATEYFTLFFQYSAIHDGLAAGGKALNHYAQARFGIGF